MEKAGWSFDTHLQGGNCKVTAQQKTSRSLVDENKHGRRRSLQILLLTMTTGTLLGCQSGTAPRVAETHKFFGAAELPNPKALAASATDQIPVVQPASYTLPQDDEKNEPSIDELDVEDLDADDLDDDEPSLRDMLDRSDDDLQTDADSIPVAEPILDSSMGTSIEAVGITLESIESITLASHPAIREQRSRIEATRGQYTQAGLPFNPVFQYQSEEIGNEGSSGLHSATLSQQIVTANKLGIAQQVQAREIQKQQAQLRIAELTVLARVRASFAQALVAQRRQQIADQIVKLAEQSVESVRSLLEAEEVSKVALLQAKVELQQATIAAENAQTQFQAAFKALAAAAGNIALPQGPLAGDLEADLVERPWESLIGEITAISPEMSLAGSELERAKWALQLACAQVVPNVTVQAGAGYDGSSDDTFGVFGVSVPLPIRNRNQGNIRTARAEIAAASAAIERTQLDLQGRLAEAVGRYEVARQRYTRLTESVIPNAQETYELASQAFEVGETDYLQLLTAQRTLFDTQLSILDAIGTAKQTAAEIDALLVRLQF